MTGIVLQLPTARSLATIDLARFTDSRTFARGLEYRAGGRVLVTDETSDSISATVVGTRPYEAQLTVSRHGVDHRCSCPVGAEGVFCKHLVALALVVSEPEADDGADDISGNELRSWLATLERAELAELLAGEADCDDELRQRLVRRRNPTAAAPIDLAAHRDAIATRFGAHRRDASPSCCWASQAHDVIDEVETLLERGHAADVREFCEFAVNCLEANAPDIVGADDELVALAARLGALHRRSCAEAPPEPVALARWLFTLEIRGDLGAFAGAAEHYADILGRAGLAEYRRLAEAARHGPKRRTAIACAIDRSRLDSMMRALDRATTRGG